MADAQAVGVGPLEGGWALAVGTQDRQVGRGVPSHQGGCERFSVGQTNGDIVVALQNVMGGDDNAIR